MLIVDLHASYHTRSLQVYKWKASSKSSANTSMSKQRPGFHDCSGAMSGRCSVLLSSDVATDEPQMTSNSSASSLMVAQLTRDGTSEMH